MEVLPLAVHEPRTNGSSFGQLSCADLNHTPTIKNACGNPNFDYNMSQEEASDRGIDCPKPVDNREYFNCLTPNKNFSSPSAYALDTGRGFQLCAGVIIPVQPWAPGKVKAQKRRMSRVSHIRGAKRVRNLFGINKVSAVDDNGNELPQQTRHLFSMAFPQNNFDNSISLAGWNREINVKNNSDDECNIVDVERVEDSKDLICDANRNVFLLPTPHRLAFPSGEQIPFLPSVSECRNPKNTAEEGSIAGCARSHMFSSNKRSRLPSSKRAKLARMDKQCLRFDRFDQESDEDMNSEDTSLLSPLASFRNLSLISPNPKQRIPNKRSRRSLFRNGDSASDAYFYDITPSRNEHCEQFSHNKISPIQLNSLFSSCSGQLNLDSCTDNPYSRQARLNLHSTRHPSTDSAYSSTDSKETENPSR